ncbi:MAG: cyclic pyranopterin monophosphate synthase MoaC, partial [Chthoniobacterales bacterium]
GKPVLSREASAEAELVCSAATIRLLKKDALPKGDVLAVAREAGIQAAKQTAALIPRCHVFRLSCVAVDCKVRQTGVQVSCTVGTTAKTVVELEALPGASVAALCLSDRCKAVDKQMRIEGVRVTAKKKSAR